jgi:ribosomal protein L37E
MYRIFHVIGYIADMVMGFCMLIIQKFIIKKEYIYEHNYINDHSVNIEIINSKMNKHRKIQTTIIYDTGCFTCCVCSESIIGPIMVCGQGHAMCEYCVVDRFRIKKKHCPVCNSSDRVRNYILEQAVLGSIIKCKYDECDTRFYKHDKEDHQLHCYAYN